jgi:hypothetical protein
MTAKNHNPVEQRLNEASRRGIMCTRSVPGVRANETRDRGFYGSNRTATTEVEQSSET